MKKCNKKEKRKKEEELLGEGRVGQLGTISKELAQREAWVLQGSLAEVLTQF